MDKLKYEKPMLVELGFDSEVMGTDCTNGPSNPPNCKAGATARIRCQVGSSFALPSVCVSGGTPGS
jgi:hypothetical protein